MDTSTVLRWKVDLLGLRGMRRDLYRLKFWRAYARRGGLRVDAERERLARLTGRRALLRDLSRDRLQELLLWVAGRTSGQQGAGTGSAEGPGRGQGRQGVRPQPGAGRVVDTVRVR